MLMVMAWCRTRSRIAVAMTWPPKTSPQLPKLWIARQDHRAKVSRKSA
jgi:hypothetical protein